MPDAVLFDLDGTLVDTAPDLGGALNTLLIERGHTALPMPVLRPHVSAGSRGLIGIGFGLKPGDADYLELQQRFLAIYAEQLCLASRLFDDMDVYLADLEGAGIPWGVVTNKPQRFALPLMEALNLRSRAACIVCGDSARRAKPGVEPMHLASAILGVRGEACLYVGDDERDVVAGKAGGMRTVVAAWGYLGDDKPVHEWGADAIADTPRHIARHH